MRAMRCKEDRPPYLFPGLGYCKKQILQLLWWWLSSLRRQHERADGQWDQESNELGPRPSSAINQLCDLGLVT